MRRDVWDEMRKMQRKMNRMFRGFDSNPWGLSDEEDLSGYRKAWIDAREEDDFYVVAIELPGVNKEDIDLVVEESGLTVKVEKSSEEKDESEEGLSYSSSYSGFYRHIPMPENADLDKIDASYRDGVLKMKIPKLGEKKKGKSVKIK